MQPNPDMESFVAHQWLDRQPAEFQFAHALLKVEPEKFVGGSPARQRWMKLVLETEVFILENNLDIEIFKKEMGLLDYNEGLMMDALENTK